MKRAKLLKIYRTINEKAKGVMLEQNDHKITTIVYRRELNCRQMVSQQSFGIIFYVVTETLKTKKKKIRAT